MVAVHWLTAMMVEVPYTVGMVEYVGKVVYALS